MDIREDKRRGVNIIGPSGRLDAVASPAFEETLMRLLDQGERRLVIDFSDLTYVSSAGLRVLVSVAKNLQKAEGKLALAALNEHIREVFKIAGFTSVFSIYPTCDEAVAYLQPD